MSDTSEYVITRAREAAADGDWHQAYELLADGDARGLIPSGELPWLAEVSYAAGHLDATIEAWERAHLAAVRGGDELGAAGAAVRVALHILIDTALMAPVRGWLSRAERLLEGKPPCPVHAWFGVARCYERLLSGDLDSVPRWALQAIEVGTQCDPAAAAVGRVAHARYLIIVGQVREGL